MIGFLLRRSTQPVLTVLGVVTAVFFLVRLAGAPSALLLPPEASLEDAARLRQALGLALTSFALGIGLAFALGLLVQLVSSPRLRTAIMWLALARQSVPVFSFGLVLILVFSVWLRSPTSRRRRSP